MARPLAHPNPARATFVLVESFGKTTLDGVDRLDQLFARSLREIEAYAGELAQTETGGFLINEAAQLLAALRLWAQTQYRSDHAVRDIL